jgi:hypothetical protein
MGDKFVSGLTRGKGWPVPPWNLNRFTQFTKKDAGDWLKWELPDFPGKLSSMHTEMITHKAPKPIFANTIFFFLIYSIIRSLKKTLEVYHNDWHKVSESGLFALTL